MINRRDFLGTAAGAGAALALSPELLNAFRAFQQSRGQLIQRAIPSTGERIPVIGLTLSNHASCANPAALKEVLKTFFDNGGRVLDTTHQNSKTAEEVTMRLIHELGIQDKLFYSWRSLPIAPPPPPGSAPPPPPPGGRGGPPPLPDSATLKPHVEDIKTRLKVPQLNLVMVGAVDLPRLAAMQQAKKEGRIKYVGVFGQRPQLEAIMRSEPIDFIGIEYSVASEASYPIASRAAEETLLPLALERKIGVASFFPFGGANGASCTGDAGLFARLTNKPLPDWAAEFEARTWAQFMLKYVVSHPAVTVVRVGTTKATHMLDNIGGGIGRLPNEAMRKRMAEFFDSMPQPALPQRGAPPPQLPVGPEVVLSAATLDRYAGEYRSSGGSIFTFRREGATLFVKPPGANATEGPLVGRGETKLSDARGPQFEFELDATGKVTGVYLLQPTPMGTPTRLWLERR
jgi:aryl-alcohol dehydrogenase-like predicted oxidoreductase